MRHRTILTLIWVACLIVVIVTVASYAFRYTSTGQRWLLPSEIVQLGKPIIIVYAAYLGGILAFWFVKPFKSPSSDAAESFRFKLALVCTLVFNACVLALVMKRHVAPDPGTFLSDDVDQAIAAAKLLSFLVGPVNGFYFGTKPAGSG